MAKWQEEPVDASWNATPKWQMEPAEQSAATPKWQMEPPDAPTAPVVSPQQAIAAANRDAIARADAGIKEVPAVVRVDPRQFIDNGMASVVPDVQGTTAPTPRPLGSLPNPVELFTQNLENNIAGGGAAIAQSAVRSVSGALPLLDNPLDIQARKLGIVANAPTPLEQVAEAGRQAASVLDPVVRAGDPLTNTGANLAVGLAPAAFGPVGGIIGGAGVVGGQEYQNARDAGATPDAARTVGGQNLAVGALTGLIPGNIAGVQGTMARTLTGAGIGAVTNAGQQVATNLIAQQSYDPERATMQDAAMGAVVGGVIGGGLNAVAPEPVRPVPPPPAPRRAFLPIPRPDAPGARSMADIAPRPVQPVQDAPPPPHARPQAEAVPAPAAESSRSVQPVLDAATPPVRDAATPQPRDAAAPVVRDAPMRGQGDGEGVPQRPQSERVQITDYLTKNRVKFDRNASTDELRQMVERDRDARLGDDDRSHIEWRENATRVENNPEASSTSDIDRAIGYLSRHLDSMRRKAADSGKPLDGDVEAGMVNNLDYLRRLWKSRPEREKFPRNESDVAASKAAPPPPAPQAAPRGEARETDYFKGDQIAYTGVVTPDGLREFVYLEGIKKGQSGVAPTKAAQEASVQKKRDDYAEQQRAFARLHEPAAPTLAAAAPKPSPKPPAPQLRVVEKLNGAATVMQKTAKGKWKKAAAAPPEVATPPAPVQPDAVSPPPAPVAKDATPATKQPWEMTREEHGWGGGAVVQVKSSPLGGNMTVSDDPISRLSPEAFDVWVRAVRTAKTAGAGGVGSAVDATKTTPADRKALAALGLSATTDRMSRPMMAVSQNKRAELARKGLEHRYAVKAAIDRGDITSHPDYPDIAPPAAPPVEPQPQPEPAAATPPVAKVEATPAQPKPAPPSSPAPVYRVAEKQSGRAAVLQKTPRGKWRKADDAPIGDFDSADAARAWVESRTKPPATPEPTPVKQGEKQPVHEQTDTIAGRMNLDEFEAKGYAPNEVTKQDWVNMMRAQRRSIGQTEESGTRYSPFADFEEFHRADVQRALKAGEVVDNRVLADYPDLAPPPPVAAKPVVKGEAETPTVTFRSLVDQSNAKKADFDKQAMSTVNADPSHADYLRKFWITEQAILNAGRMTLDDFVSGMNQTPRRDMATGNAASLIRRVSGVSVKEATRLAKDIAPSRFTRQHYKNTRNPDLTSGVTATTAMRPADDVYRVAHRAAVEQARLKSNVAAPPKVEAATPLSAVAAKYGWRVEGNSVYAKNGNKAFDFEVKKGRVRILNSDGSLGASFAESKPETLGKILEKRYYAKTETATPAAAKPAPKPKPVEVAGGLNLREVERRLIDWYDSINPTVSNQIESVAQNDDLVLGASPAIATDSIEALRGFDKLKAKKYANGGQGEDFLGELQSQYGRERGQKMYDEYVAQTLGGRPSRLAEAKKAAGGDPEMAKLAYLHDRLLSMAAKDRPATEKVNPAELPDGSTWTTFGEKFTITTAEDGTKMMEDGVTVPVDHIGDMPADKGSVVRSEATEFDPNEDLLPPPSKTTGQQLGLLGERYDGGITGSKTADMFAGGVEPDAKPPVDDSVDAKIARQYDPKATEPLPFEGGSNRGAMASPAMPMADLPGNPTKSGRTEPSPLADGKPLRTYDEIRKDLETALDKVVKATTPNRGSIGTYYPSSTRTVVGGRGDLDTTFHEIAHNLDDRFGIVAKWAKPRGYNKAGAAMPQKAPFDSEIRAPIFQQSSRKHYPVVMKRAEGVAEFIRAWMINPEAAKKAAPKFHAWFEQQVPDKARAALRAAGDDIRRIIAAGPDAMTKANMRLATRPKTFTERAADYFSPEHGPWRERLDAAFRDDIAPIMNDIALAKKLGGVTELLPVNDPLIRIRNYAGVPARIEEWVTKGPLDINNQPVKGLGGVDWIVEPLKGVEPDKARKVLADAMAVGVSERAVDEARMLDEAVKTLGDMQEQATEARAAMRSAMADGDPDAIKNAQEQVKAIEREIKSILKSNNFSGPPEKFPAYVARKKPRLTGAGAGFYPDDKVAAAALDKLKADPDYAAAAEVVKRYRDYAAAGMRLLRDAGRISDKQYQSITSGNQFYFAWKRVMDDVASLAAGEGRGRPGGSRKMGAAGQPIKTMEGAQRTIDDPLVALIENTALAVREAERNASVGTFFALLSKPRDMYQGRPIDFDQIASRAKAGDRDTIRVFVKGKAEYWQPRGPLYRAFKGMDQDVIDTGVHYGLSKLVNFRRQMITLSPAYMARNFVRDQMGRTIVSNVKGTPIDTLKAIYSGELAPDISEMHRFGGGNSGFFGSHEKVSAMVADAVRRAAGEPDTIISTFPRMIEAARRLQQIGEEATRGSEYLRAKKYAMERLGYDDVNASMYGAYEARSLQDFAVAGRIPRYISRYVTPMVAGGMRGLFKTLETAGANPGRTATRMLMVLGSMELLSALWNHMSGAWEKERDLPAYRQDFFYNFHVGNGWIAVPRLWEQGLPGAAMRRAWHRASGNKNAFDGFAGSAVKAMAPTDVDALIAGPFSAAAEQLWNRDMFTGMPIIPFYEQDVRVDLRKGTAKASAIGRGAQAVTGVDARRVDQLLRSTLGWPGDMTMRLADAIEGKPGALARIASRGTGFYYETPGSSPDVSWVMDWARSNKKSQDRGIRQLQSTLERSREAPTAAEREKIARQAHQMASQIRRNIEARK